MTLSLEMAGALNRQASIEASSAFMYYTMESWFEYRSLKGFANWCRVEAQGEMTHMTRFFEYVNMRGSQVVFDDIKAPALPWQSPLEVFKDIHNQEVLLTAKINDLVLLAQKHSDHATQSFLNTFIMEQIQDEAEANSILSQIKMVGDDSQGILMISNSLENRKANAE